MLVIAGTIRIDPAKQSEAIPAALEVMEATRAESGCISYCFTAALADPGLIHVFEEWESPEALDAHFKTPHMAKFQQEMAGFGIQDMKIQRYEVSSVGPLGG
ncbi:MAG: putative quinol monooxygenase [Myxococcota bacterium]